MDILKELRKKKEKKTIKKTLTAIVATIIDTYQLDDDFLSFLETPPDLVLQKLNTNHRNMPKPRLNVQVFPLFSRKSYLLAKELISKLDNPYLRYSRDPLEIYLSRLLYRENPLLDKDLLNNNHFAAFIKTITPTKQEGNQCTIPCPPRADKK